ncbi:MAG: bifunctional proline dehydrogenase/L-glutamate gamma-semialdehyde dehydrogenase PutA [Rhodocyclaceae bacterium]|nr:bifunctional proline dehydrogenase/L-glutamate gamma-semialdehyde dehydrogenase PutA [Rhodocyclaceae bacterium]MBX3668870.1 bifunctional proline dehydrogenase/L-glutamate gamma-semialdehyde dehydrogenase PutA [Rhodocyclaceae bacterium]
MTEQIPSQPPSRIELERCYRLPERDALQALAEFRLDPEQAFAADARARALAQALRARRSHGSGVDALMQEFDLASREGQALMALAESLLRVPDAATRDALLADKLQSANWGTHLYRSPSLFVNAAALGLSLACRIARAAKPDVGGMSHLLARLSEPLNRQAVAQGVQFLGSQFVAGENIAEALGLAAERRARYGWLYSFDMLGEAAVCADDALRYYAAYSHAVRSLGFQPKGDPVHGRHGISVKLSALHARFHWSQSARVHAELYPRLLELARLSAACGIGLTIDAEEADRLDLSLDLFDRLLAEPDLAGWSGLGFVVQAYQKRALALVDYLTDSARAARRCIAIRLVKGAYWDAEIKRAQVAGAVDYPVYTRKVHTDLSYLACAQKLLAARDVLHPQFATHNAHSVAAVLALAGDARGYEFQCLHGMGELLFRCLHELDAPSPMLRVYGPVGRHADLLAYLVRRLLENGANASFVHRVLDSRVDLDKLLADPYAAAAASGWTPNPRLPLPRDLYPQRLNSLGIDLSAANERAAMSEYIVRACDTLREVRPILAVPLQQAVAPRAMLSPGDWNCAVGAVYEIGHKDVTPAVCAAQRSAWPQTAAHERAAVLHRAADLIEDNGRELAALIVLEAGRTIPNALNEVREAADFCRYYAQQLKSGVALGLPLGPVVCISPWNFPLAIFTGQIAAALAAGNPVLAKPAEQTPFVAARAVGLLHAAGVARDALQLLPGDGMVGAALVREPEVRGVLFTGSCEVAAEINATLAGRLPEVVLVAETGGQNAMIVDSTALPEQVVADVVASAFDSAGQRCSSLRLLCLQSDVADRIIDLLIGTLDEMSVGNPKAYATDIGPVIDASARERLRTYVEARRRAGRMLWRKDLGQTDLYGEFVAPVLLLVDHPGELTQEVFGPVLHVMRYRTAELDMLLDAINGLGYGLTFGIQSRMDTLAERAAARVRAGNVYVNRNMIGAVVGVQPFGGEGLSGTGPKAGGPLLLARLTRNAPPPRLGRPVLALPEAFRALIAWGEATAPGSAWLARARRYAEHSLWPTRLELDGPEGESNRLGFASRGTVLLIAAEPDEYLAALAAALATGNRVLVDRAAPLPLAQLPDVVQREIGLAADALAGRFDAVLCAAEPERAAQLRSELAGRQGPIIAVLERGAHDWPLERLVVERSVSVNIAAAGGNATLMAQVE